MLRRRRGSSQQAQTILEYVIIFGVILSVLFIMGPIVKRGLQGMIKMTADQIGTQQNAEQAFDDTGHMESSYVSSRAVFDRTTQESLGVTTYLYGDEVSFESTTIVNLGFTETP